jgi:diguanylate cyclase (GGDEF)-like protein
MRKAGWDMAADDITMLAKLRGLLEVTRLVRSEGDLTTLLGAIARTIRVSLGFQVVVMNVYRPEWDDFFVAVVEGGEDVRDALLGATYGWDTWRRVLDQRYERRGAYHVREGEFDWSEHGARFVPDLGTTSDPGGWHAEDELFVPFRHSDGHLLGIVSVGEPGSGLRPTEDEIDILVAVTAHAALVMQSAQEAAEMARHRRSLEQLLDVSSKLADKQSTEAILDAVSDAIRDAIGFDRVAVELADHDTGQLVVRASAGWPADHPALKEDRPHIDEVRSLMTPEFEVGGCYLLPETEALRRMARPRRTHISTLNGRGPRAWHDYWLFVPLYGGDGNLAGRIWVDDPLDRLLPSTQRLQALRLFADQASAALALAARMDELRFLADHDPLTGLLNRRAFIRDLAAEIDRCNRYRHTFALMVCDLDGFKELNDREGHPAGDEALRQVSTVLTEGTRISDRVFRIGGDEFALLLPEADREGAPLALRRLTKTFQERVRKQLRGVDASFGIAIFPDDGPNTDELFRAADAALYEAKRTGLKLVFAHKPA